MAHRKRTRTTSTERGRSDPRLSPNARKLQNLRRDVAVEAARIMATEGQRNFMAAKRKAAERIGAGPRIVLPSNREVEEALRAYQGFFGGEDHTHKLSSLREVAVEVMRHLEQFQPRLVGPVLDGTADQYSRVSLHLFNDPPEAVLWHLDELAINFHEEQRKIRWHDGSHRLVQLLVTELREVTIELVLFDLVDLRQAPPSPVDGRPQKRAALQDVEILLAVV